jgi:hypothetical protein
VGIAYNVDILFEGMVMKKAFVVVSIVALGFGVNALSASAKPIVFDVKFSNCTQLRS